MSSRLRWHSVILPVLVIGAVELVFDGFLDNVVPFPLEVVILVAAVFVVVSIGSHMAFGTVDRLTAVLQDRNAELEARNASSAALHRVTMAMNALVDIEEILHAVVVNARELLGADVALLVLEGSEAAPRLVASSGPADAIHAAGDLPGHGYRRFVDPRLLAATLGSPLQRGDRTVGVLAVGAAGERAWGIDGIESLASLASQAAVALENDRLQRDLREMAIRSERERIAREMHDGLAQVLGYVNTKSQAIEELLAGGRVEQARGQLEELANASRSVYVDVREAILGLSSPIAPDLGVVGALEAYVPRFAEASKLAATVAADREARALRLRPEVQAQVFRIVQEALTNVRKHARAQRVAVRLEVAGDELQVCIADDGRGIEPSPAGSGDWPHYGLQAMRDRARTFGGDTSLEPRPEGGTALRVRVPLAGTVEVA